MATHKGAALKVEDVVRSPGLQLKLLAGAAGLGRTVSWAHVSELRDPTPWLLGAEILMTTGLAVPESAKEQREYLERLDDAGVSALALSAALHVPPLHAEFLEAAEERGMPVLEVPLPVPFIAIAQEVAAAVHEDVRQRLGAQLQVFGALRWLAAEHLDAAELMRRLERLSGYHVYLCTPAGRPLLPGVPAPPESHVGLLPTSQDAPPTVPGGFVLPVPAPGGPAGYLLALERDGVGPAGLAVVQHIATVAALAVTMDRHERETLRREGAETLSELLQDVLDAPTAERRLARAGFGAHTPLTLMIVRPTRGRLDEDAVVRTIEATGIPHLMLRRETDLCILTAAKPKGSSNVSEPPTSTFDPTSRALNDTTGIAAGVSRPFAAGTPLRVPQCEAQWAAARAVESGQAIVHYGDDPTARWLPQDAATLVGLVDHVLGPALGYDETHNSDLVTSVRTWLERDRRTDDSARALHVHPNTLAYRLKRFGALTGRDLTASADLAEVWLAVRAAQQLGRIP